MSSGAGLVLASTSRYRRELLARLRLEFDTVRPDVDETPFAGEAPAAPHEPVPAGSGSPAAATSARLAEASTLR